jgi:hypothetical protein
MPMADELENLIDEAVASVRKERRRGVSDVPKDTFNYDSSIFHDPQRILI